VNSWRRIASRALARSGPWSGEQTREHLELAHIATGTFGTDGEVRHDDVADVVRRAEPQHHAVRELAGELKHLRTERADKDRKLRVRAETEEPEVRRVDLPVVGDLRVAQ
jgi:hypothetical protein